MVKKGAEGAAWNHRHTLEQKALWSMTRSTPIFVYDSPSLIFNSIVSGYENLANFLGVHTNTARRAVKLGNVYANKYILSLSMLDLENLQRIKEKIIIKSTKIRVVYIYNSDKTVLLKTFPSVNAFIKYSKLSGSNVKLLCNTNILWLNEYFLSYDLITNADNTLNSIHLFKPKRKGKITPFPVYTYSADGKTFIKAYSSIRSCVKDLEGHRNAPTNSLELRIEHKELFHGFIVSHSPLFDHPIKPKDK